MSHHVLLPELSGRKVVLPSINNSTFRVLHAWIDDDGDIASVVTDSDGTLKLLCLNGVKLLDDDRPPNRPAKYIDATIRQVVLIVVNGNGVIVPHGDISYSDVCVIARGVDGVDVEGLTCTYRGRSSSGCLSYGCSVEVELSV